MTDGAQLLADRLMPRFEPGAVHDRVSARWVFADGTFPVPVGGWLACPVCRDTVIQLARYHFHRRRDSATYYRCDVQMKCTACSATWTHGVVVPKAVWKRGMDGENTARVWQYREVCDVLDLNDGS